MTTHTFLLTGASLLIAASAIACSSRTPPTPTPSAAIHASPPTAETLPQPIATPTPAPRIEPTATAAPAPASTGANGGQAVSLPADDAPHPRSTTEWWYYSGHLETSDGKRYAFHYVVFAVRLPGLPQATLAQFALSDLDREFHYTEQRAIVATTAASPAPGFDFDIRGWRMTGYDGHDRISASIGSRSIDLRLESTKRPVLHGETGNLDVTTSGQSSYYYSRTRLRIEGSIVVDGITLPVSGLAWFDHQWGDFRPLALGWDWFALQLDDGSDVMLYRIRDLATGDTFRYGTFVDATGDATTLAGQDFIVSPGGPWRSPATGIEYPLRWAIDIPAQGVSVAVTGELQASEFDARGSTGNVYWEGSIAIEGSHSGQGFMELVGYGGSPSPPSR